MRSEYVTTAVIRHGRLKVSQPQYFIDAIKTFKDGPVLVSVKAANKVTRSREANAAYWAGLIRPFSAYTGIEPLALHGYLKTRFLQPEHIVLTDANGEIRDECDIARPTTVTLSPSDFANFFEQASVCAAELGVPVGGSR